MALTFWRWVAAVVAGCLVALTLALTPLRAPRPQRALGPRELVASRDRRLDGALEQAALRLRALQLRDSVAGILQRLPRSDTSRLLISRALPDASTRLIAVVTSRMTTLRLRPAAGRMDLVFLSDTGATIGGRYLGGSPLRVTYFLPDGSRDCLSLARMRPLRVESWWRARITGASGAMELAGPCSFYEAFGPPGPLIDRWLRAGAWRYGLSGAWGRDRPARFYDDEYVPLSVRLFGFERNLRRFLSSAGFRCASGDAAACRGMVLDESTDAWSRRETFVTTEGMVTRRWSGGDDWWWFDYSAALGPSEPRLLGDMARALGPERFRAFWASNQAPPEAFAAAAGQDIGAWTAGWAERTYGRLGRGPGLTGTSVVFAGLVSFLALGGAIVTSRRRQVT